MPLRAERVVGGEFEDVFGTLAIRPESGGEEIIQDDDENSRKSE